MLYSVYILLSKKDEKLYVGCTSNFENRIERHNAGHVPATKYRRPLAVIHRENFIDKTSAFKRERFLKSLYGAREKKNILKRWLKQFMK